jgi:gluconokinase
MKVPVSPYLQIDGMVYFRRMLDKARLFAAGELREDLRSNLGKAMDAWTCEFFGVSYPELSTRLRVEGTSDADLLEWCFSEGKRPTDQEIKVWNAYMTKIGWRDYLSERLFSRKSESGFADRDDIQTMFDYIDADEGRAPGDALTIN